ncbi:adenosylcobinamide-phosphate synthase CbiB [Bacillus tianshenii]|nr:adenosylcobinamide-phosphate synthase CbiB [Bacillus tianshenii]
MEHVIAALVALAFDKWIGDPEHLPHPVRLIGALISKLDRAFNQGRFRKGKGVLTVLIVSICCFLIPLAIITVAYQLHLIIGIAVEAVLIFTTIALNDLEKAARRVEIPLRAGDFTEARAKLGWIVGRDTDTLGESEIVRGTVETVSENTSDGITAPLFYALLGGAPLAFFYRGVNTCDAMLGYKNEKYISFGWASARLDDLLNLIPSRLTGIAMLLANAKKYNKHVGHLVKKLPIHARKHPSPNSGWCEAATALLLGVQLGGQNHYQGTISNRPLIGTKTVSLATAHIHEAIQIMKRTTVMFLTFISLGVLIIDYLFT